MNNILHRIQQIADFQNISIGKLELIIGASKGVLYKAIQKNTDIQSKWLVAIAENFPQINTEWLLIGKGEMNKKESRTVNFLSEPAEEYGNSSKIIDTLKNEISYKNDIIAGLQRENKLLWKYVDENNGDKGKAKIG